jgi:hypothetical protein
MIIDFTFDVESPSDSFDNHAFQIGLLFAEQRHAQRRDQEQHMRALQPRALSATHARTVRCFRLDSSQSLPCLQC